jgi:hypothetical protein
MTTNTFKVSFVHNEIHSIKLIELENSFPEDIYCYKNNGHLVYAIIKANNEAEARRKALRLIKNLRNQ